MAAVVYHPETVQLEEMRKKAGKIFDKNIAVEKFRQENELYATAMAKLVTYQYSGAKFELFIPSPDWPDGIPVYVYRPSSLLPNPPVLIYFHGGGMAIGSRNTCDITCQMLSEQAKCVIVNAEYRLYPENKFEAPFEDGALVTNWILKNKRLIGAGNDSKVGVGGDSAGGKVASVAAHEVPGIAFQVLIYPLLSATATRLPSYEQFKDNAPVLTLEAMEWFEKQIQAAGFHPRCDSLNRSAESFKSLPPTLLVFAEIDILRDESIEYAKKLNEYGVIHETFLVPGTCHSFYTTPGIFKECCKIAYDATTNFIHKHGY